MGSSEGPCKPQEGEQSLRQQNQWSHPRSNYSFQPFGEPTSSGHLVPLPMKPLPSILLPFCHPPPLLLRIPFSAVLCSPSMNTHWNILNYTFYYTQKTPRTPNPISWVMFLSNKHLTIGFPAKWIHHIRFPQAPNWPELWPLLPLSYPNKS